MNTTPDTPTQTRIDVAVLATDLAYIRRKIDEICASDQEQDERIDSIERVTWAVSSVSALIAAILVPVAVAAVKKWLGL